MDRGPVPRFQEGDKQGTRALGKRERVRDAERVQLARRCFSRALIFSRWWFKVGGLYCGTQPSVVKDYVGWSGAARVEQATQ